MAAASAILAVPARPIPRELVAELLCRLAIPAPTLEAIKRQAAVVIRPVRVRFIFTIPWKITVIYWSTTMVVLLNKVVRPCVKLAVT